LTMAARSTIAAVISISKVLWASLRLILSRRPTIPVHLTGVIFDLPMGGDFRQSSSPLSPRQTDPRSPGVELRPVPDSGCTNYS
jgi:hypothetical protein